MADLTEDEKAVVYRLGQVWNMFLLLPTEHADDTTEFRHGIHALQHVVLARAGRREMNGGQFDASKWRGWTEEGERWLAGRPKVPPPSPEGTPPPPRPSR